MNAQLVALRRVAELTAGLRSLGVRDARRQALREVESFYSNATLGSDQTWVDFKAGVIRGWRDDPSYCRFESQVLIGNDLWALRRAMHGAAPVAVIRPQRAREPRARAAARIGRRSRSSSRSDDPHEPADDELDTTRAGRRV
jgi:hypothetical protein